MRISPDGRFTRTDIWREGNYLDLWSVPHLLSGVIVGVALYLFGFEARSAFTIAFLLLVAYEMFEVIAKIDETRWNRTLDVVVGMVSCVPAFLLAPAIPRTQLIEIFIAICVLDAFLSFLGWSASRKAAVLEERLKAEYEREKEKFTRRRANVGKRIRASLAKK